MFWDNYSDLCRKKGISPNRAAAEIGISSGSVTAWKNGRLPRRAVLARIADYFSVSVEELLSQKEKPAETGEPIDTITQDFVEILNKLTPEQKRALYDSIRALLPKEE